MEFIKFFVKVTSINPIQFNKDKNRYYFVMERATEIVNGQFTQPENAILGKDAEKLNVLEDWHKLISGELEKNGTCEVQQIKKVEPSGEAL